jgi:hypothetical protein
MHNCRPSVALLQDVGKCQRGRYSHKVYAVTAVEVKTVRIGTRGSPLALAQAYMTRDLLKVMLITLECQELSAKLGCFAAIPIKHRLSKEKRLPALSNISEAVFNVCRNPSQSSERRVPSRSASSRPQATKCSTSPLQTLEAKGYSQRRSMMPCWRAELTLQCTL